MSEIKELKLNEWLELSRKWREMNKEMNKMPNVITTTSRVTNVRAKTSTSFSNIFPAVICREDQLSSDRNMFLAHIDSMDV